jgi:hypothetical protein
MGTFSRHTHRKSAIIDAVRETPAARYHTENSSDNLMAGNRP